MHFRMPSNLNRDNVTQYTKFYMLLLNCFVSAWQNLLIVKIFLQSSLWHLTTETLKGVIIGCSSLNGTSILVPSTLKEHHGRQVWKDVRAWGWGRALWTWVFWILHGYCTHKNSGYLHKTCLRLGLWLFHKGCGEGLIRCHLSLMSSRLLMVAGTEVAIFFCGVATAVLSLITPCI